MHQRVATQRKKKLEKSATETAVDSWIPAGKCTKSRVATSKTCKERNHNTREQQTDFRKSKCGGGTESELRRQ